MTRNLTPWMRTTLPGVLIAPRLYVAAVCVVDGLRALRINVFLGRSVLERVPFELQGLPLMLMGVLLVIAGAMLAVGFLTRFVSVVPLVISVMIILEAYVDIGTLGTAEAINYTVRAFGTASVSIVLLLRGAGVWSVDAGVSAGR